MAEEQPTQGNGAGNGSAGASALSALKSKELLVPAALSAAAAVAAAKGPDLMRRLGHSAEEKGQEEASKVGEHAAQGALQPITGGEGGGATGLVGKVAGKALGKGGGGGGSGGKKTRRLTIQRWTDVAVPVNVAYDEWTKFDRFPQFMHRVLNVRRRGDDKVTWEEKIWFSKRQWEARITDRRKNDRIAWKTISGVQHYGVVSFHEIDDRLTRVMVTMEFEPSGIMEKMASGLRFVKRAVQADLARFKTQVEFKDAQGLQYRAEQQEEQSKKQREEQQSKKRDKNGNGDAEKQRQERERRRDERREAVGAQ